jgi:hypothetical protein
MARSNFENLEVYRLSEQVADEVWDKETVCRLKPLLDELAPRLNAYLKSIGRGSASPPASAHEQLTTDNGQRTTD